MGKVPKPNIVWRGCHPNNFSRGRSRSRDGRKTDHHIVGSLVSARNTFANPSRGASSHYGVGANGIDQYVNIGDTAWADGNWESNQKTISIEHEGGWNGGTGPYTDAMYEKAAHLTAWLIENYGVTWKIKHREVSRTGTVCPGKLDTDRIWNRAKEIIKKYNNVDNRPAWLKNRKAIKTPYTVYSHKDGLFLYNMNALPKPVDARRFSRNQDFKVSSYVDVGGKRYLFTESSTKTNAPNGILESEVSKSPWVAPSKWEKMLTPRPMIAVRKLSVIDLDTMKATGDPIPKDKKVENLVEKKTVKGEVYLRTKWSRDNNKNWGIKLSDLVEVPAPKPEPKPEPIPEPQPEPVPETPDWVDSIIDLDNQTLYVIRETYLVDLENGHPVLDKDGNEIKFPVGHEIKDASAQAIISERTYWLTEYSYLETAEGRWANASGILADDLAVDPDSVVIPEEPEDEELNILQGILATLLSLVDKIKDLISRRTK